MTAASRQTPTVLVVEDDRLLRCLALEVLQEEGFEVIGAADAVEALTCIRARADLTLLVSDINMPGMSGLELVRLAKSERPALKLLMISGREWVDEASLPQPAKFLQKPFSAYNFLEIVRRLMST